MRNFGGRSGVVMPAEPRTQAAFARHGITTNPCGGTDTFPGSGAFTGSNTDLSWVITQPGENGDFELIGDTLTMRHNTTLPATWDGWINTVDEATSDDVFVEAVYIAASDPNTINEQVRLVARALDYDFGTGSGIVLSIYYDINFFIPNTYTWEVYDMDNGSILDHTGSSIPGSPGGTWRMECEGDDVRVYLDSVLLDTGTGAPLSANGRHAALDISASGEGVLTDEIGPVIATFSYGCL